MKPYAEKVTAVRRRIVGANWVFGRSDVQELWNEVLLAEDVRSQTSTRRRMQKIAGWVSLVVQEMNSRSKAFESFRLRTILAMCSSTQLRSSWEHPTQQRIWDRMLESSVNKIYKGHIENHPKVKDNRKGGGSHEMQMSSQTRQVRRLS